MKTILLLLALTLTCSLTAQEAKPVLEQQGEMVKATYYYENGNVRQQGYFKEGKLEGQWVSFDAVGNKKAIAEYNNGIKTGQWVFWNERVLSEVSYSDSRVAAVKTWHENSLVKN